MRHGRRLITKQKLSLSRSKARRYPVRNVFPGFSLLGVLVAVVVLMRFWVCGFDGVGAVVRVEDIDHEAIPI